MKYEFKVIADLIEKDKRVLDVGCSDGTLMKFLKDNKNINIRGLEISKDQVQKWILTILWPLKMQKIDLEQVVDYLEKKALHLICLNKGLMISRC